VTADSGSAARGVLCRCDYNDLVKQSNGRRIEVESASNRSCNQCLTSVQWQRQLKLWFIEYATSAARTKTCIHRNEKKTHKTVKTYTHS